MISVIANDKRREKKDKHSCSKEVFTIKTRNQKTRVQLN